MEVKPGKASTHDLPLFDTPATDPETLAGKYLSVRRLTQKLCLPLQLEDYGLQAAPFTSPVKWHLAHTTWFFETFVLKPFCPKYSVFHPQFETLFNSYYNGIGNQYPRAQRSLLSRPTLDEVNAYRQHVDETMTHLLQLDSGLHTRDIAARTLLGCHHEQQHQELLFTDLKYCWYQNPLFPAYCSQPLAAAKPEEPARWQSLEGGLQYIGHGDNGDFCFDNELPRHQQYIAPFRIADRLVSNGEYADFIRDDGYKRPELWLADGWVELQARTRAGIPNGPAYWSENDGEWMEFSLHGIAKLDPHRPASHLSAYEADAYARWAGCRLPTEFEWEVAVQQAANGINPSSGNPGQFLHLHSLHPDYSVSENPLNNILGQLWQWTSSAYSPYPGFNSAEGAIGEYNGKFMTNQLVLRGGSCATSKDHFRHSYRNFFYPPDQWQFTGIRLAKDV